MFSISFKDRYDNHSILMPTIIIVTQASTSSLYNNSSYNNHNRNNMMTSMAIDLEVGMGLGVITRIKTTMYDTYLSIIT